MEAEHNDPRHAALDPSACRDSIRTRLGIACWLLCLGCQGISNHLTQWHMLGQEALEDPVQAVGGDATVVIPAANEASGKKNPTSASPQELVRCYAPVFVQQRVNTAAGPYPYPPEYDRIGAARLERDAEGKLRAFVAGPPTVYAIYQKRRIGARDHVQLTYTAWYPAHPRMKAIDLEEARIDSCVLRITLDDQNAPLFYETIAACGCFHKVFVARRLEDAALEQFAAPEKGHTYAVERVVKNAIDWEVAGTVDDPRDHPSRPVVFLKAGDHKVIGLNSSARLHTPPPDKTATYALTDYSELYALPVEGTTEKAPFFNLADGGKVWGAERKERFVFHLIGVDDAGHPRANDQIKLHFDQSTWDDMTIYGRYLRLPPGTL
jgi:hypothetical protein